MLLSCNTANNNTNFTEIHNNISTSPIFLGEPPSNAGTTLIKEKDGSISFIYRPGDWDLGGFSDTVFFINTIDEGRTWSQEKVLAVTGPGSQCFSSISPVSGEVIIFFIRNEKGVKGNYRFVRTNNKRTDWSYNKLFDTLSFGGMGYGNCLWIELPDGNNRILTGVHGENKGAGTYYSDDDGYSWTPSNRSFVPNLIPNIWHTSSVEPSLIQLKNKKIWMLMRNSNDRLWETFSNDNGESWAEARSTEFYCGPNSWVTTKRLSDGKILLIWNNAMCLDASVTQDKWNFTNREVLHAAISSDDGKSWHGFRELMLDKLRDNNFINHPGDKGLNESKAIETNSGNVLIACGQAPGHREFVLLDPDWLFEKNRFDDFSEGLIHWSRQKIKIRKPVYNRLYHHNYDRKPGARLIDHPDEEGKKVLQIRRLKDSTVYAERDGAVWNFPAGKSGIFETKILLKEKFKGCLIALNDRWFQPTDSEGEKTAMYALNIPANGVIQSGIELNRNQWYTIKLVWKNINNENSDYCDLFINDEKTNMKIWLKNKSHFGISYVRFRSTSVNPDNEGLLVDYVRAESKDL